MKNVRKYFGRLQFGIFICVALVCMVSVGRLQNIDAANKNVTMDLRFIFTTDIHGQLNSTDYETGGSYNIGGLAKAYTLIKEAREEIANSLTFDVGDVMYDYTTEYFYSAHQSMVQPIYQAMSMIGYDAMTLGNHEFDYDYEYIKSQLKNAGLLDKIIVSNLTDSKNGVHEFAENRIITKLLTTNTKETVEVKIGVIGETLPVLSAKGQNFTGVLKVQDIVENVTEQAAKLKEQGADIIVVLNHSGMGPNNPEYGEKNTSYELTKIDDVDVVLCGHEHNQFPSEDKTIAYYKLPGTDKVTGLVNDKNLVMAQDRGKSIGIVDLTLGFDDEGQIEIRDRKSEVRRVADLKPAEDKSIASLYDPYKEELLSYSKTIIGTVEKGQTINNYHGLLEDTSAVQLLNDAKRAYALNYIHNNAPDYIGYPVIAASNYISYGKEGYNDFVTIQGEMTESDLASIQGYNGYTSIYKITGAQLREWLEWSASAYETTTNHITPYSDKILSQWIGKKNLKPLIQNDWIDNWSPFYVFDGVEYKINPLIAPRYNHSGVRINATNRVTELTYNGEPVRNDQVFVLAVGKLAKTTDANAGVEKQAIYKGYVRTQSILRDYISQRSKLGALNITPDYNFSLIMPNNYKFLVKTTGLAQDVSKKDWFVENLETAENYIYSVGSFHEMPERLAPNVLVTPTNTKVTSYKVKVAVEVTAKNKIQLLKWVKGDYDEKYNNWATAQNVENGGFYAEQNGIYTVYARDILGNVTIQKIKIDNIYSDALAAPTVATYTNRKTKLTGKVDPGKTIVVETMAGEKYKAQSSVNGSFSIKLPSQPSGSTVTVYAMDENKSLLSEKVTVKVKRTGPNQPSVYGVYNNSDKIYGNLNDKDADVIAIIGNVAYVGSDRDAELLKLCTTLYNETMTIIKTNVSVDQSLEYEITVPVQKVGTQVKIYTLDHLGRSSMVNTMSVLEVAPNPPTLYELTSIDTKLYGNITRLGKETYYVYAIIGDKMYETTADNDGDFCIDILEPMMDGQEISVYAQSSENGKVRTSYITKAKVKSPEDYVQEENELFISAPDAGDYSIHGSNFANEELTIAIM